MQRDTQIIQKTQFYTLASDRSNNEEMASEYTNKALSKIQQFLEKGIIHINQTQQRLPERIKSSQKTDKGLRYLFKNKSKQTQRDEENSRQLMPNEEHKKIIRKFIREKEEMDKRRERMLTEMKKKREVEYSRQNSIETEVRTKVAEERKRILEEKARQRQQSIIKREQELREANTRFNKVRNTKHLHQILEQKSKNQMLFMSLQDKKKKLKQRRELRKPMNMNEFKQFQSQYTNKKHKLQTELQNKRNKSIPPKYDPPLKSSRLTQFLQDQMNQQHLKQQQKKTQLQLKLKRFKDYSRYIRDNFKPQTERRSITPVVSICRNNERHKTDERKLGNEYLKYSKLHTRMNNRSENHSLETVVDTGGEEMKNINYLNSKDVKYYDGLRQKRMNKIMETEELSKRDKIEELNKEADKIDQYISRKSALSRVRNKKNQEEEENITCMLLASVKAKVGMLEILKN